MRNSIWMAMKLNQGMKLTLPPRVMKKLLAVKLMKPMRLMRNPKMLLRMILTPF